MYQRKRIDNLTAEELTRLLDAFGQLETSGEFGKISALHAKCPHASGQFLPWHRAYIFIFEQALRAASNDSSIALPYWDWVRTRKIPPAVEKRPLWRKRFTDQTRPKERTLPTRADIDAVQSLSFYVDYGGWGCPDEDEGGGSLENQHGFPHHWVSEDMALATKAATDPIFFMHHAFVDKLWADWQATNGEDPDCLDVALNGLGKWTARDVLTTTGKTLGYEYVEDHRVALTDVTLGRRDVIRLPVGEPFTGRRLLMDVLGMTAEGPGDVPASIDVHFPGSREVVARVSLFGLFTPKQAAHHSGHHGYGSNRRLLLGDASDVRFTNGLELSLAGAAGEHTSSVRIQAIALMAK